MAVLSGIYVTNAFAKTNNDDRYMLMLSSIGVAGTLNEDWQGKITRGEFVHYANEIFDYPTSEAQAFSDVYNTYEYAKDINSANASNVLVVEKSGKFYPESGITLGEATAVLIKSLGYDKLAEKDGKYLDEYMKLAQTVNMLKNIEIGTSSEMTRAEAYQLLWNMLESYVYEWKKDGANTVYTLNENKNVLEDKFKIRKIQGQITANDRTALTPYSAAALQNNVVISGSSYSCGDTCADEYLGFKVKAYVRYDEDYNENTLLYVEKDINNSYIVIDAKDVTQASKSKLVYTNENNIKKTINIKRTVDFVYNNKARAFDNQYYLTPERGNITFVDYDGDGTYDLIDVKSYVTYVVNGVDVKNGTVTDKYGMPVLKIGEGQLCRANITRDGTKITVDDIEEWEILSVCADGEKVDESGKRSIEKSDFYDIISSRNMQVGVLNSINENEIRVNGINYKISEYYKRTVKEKNIKNITSGNLAYIYFDYCGEIAAINTEDISVDKYGYAVSVGEESDGSVYIKILETNNKFAAYMCADKVDFDGVKLNSTDESSKRSVYSSFFENGVLKRKLISYELNSENKIIRINTETKTDDINDPLVKIADFNKLRYKSAAKTIGSKYIIKNALIFKVPADEASEAEKQNMENYKILNISQIINDSMIDGAVYNRKRAGQVGILVIKSDVSSEKINDTTTACVVQEAYTAVNKDNEAVQHLKIMNGKQLLEFDLASSGLNITDYFTGQRIDDYQFKSGDVIRYELNNNDEIGTVEKMISIGDNFDNSKGTDILCRCVYGSVYDYHDGIIELIYDEAESSNENRQSEVFNTDVYNVLMMTYDKSTQTVKVMESGDISTYLQTGSVDTASKAVVCTRYADLKTVIIYND